jgi:hypothetical protein
MRVSNVGALVSVLLLSGIGCSGATSGFGSDSGGSDAGGGGDDALDLDVSLGEVGTPFVCTPSPGNYDIPGNNCDDDGDGQVDNTPVCDSGLKVDSTDAGDFAKALGLCQTATDPKDVKWGVISAKYTNGYQGKNPVYGVQHGILPKFGGTWTAREGQSLGVLSSGYAREYDSLDSYDFFRFGQDIQGGENIPNGAPPGYPRAAAGCDNGIYVKDPIGVELTIKVPDNAQGIQFDFNFASGEWPEYVCTLFNDAFVAWLTSSKFPGQGGDLNISYDAHNNPVSVNNAFFQVCAPDTGANVSCIGGKPHTVSCPLGAEKLKGTGFYDPGVGCDSQQSSGGGATDWLTSQAPVKPGEVMKIQFIIWDTQDPVKDSSVLLDHWVWQPTPTTTGTWRPPQ